MSVWNTLGQFASARRGRRATGRIGYIGSLGRGNAGDEAMFHAAQLLVGRRLDPVLSLTREQLLAMCGAGINRLAGVILGGGTLINADRLPLIRWILDQDVPVYALGTGVGSAGFSMQDESLNTEWAALLSRFKAVGVRGPLSLEKIQEAGGTNADVVGDLALALTPEIPLAEPSSKKMLVSFAPARNAQDAALLRPVREDLAVILGAYAKAGWDILPVAFDIEDHEPLAKLAAAAGLSQQPQTITDFEAYQELARVASFSIGVRLHSGVFAAMSGVPNLLLAYRDKCADFAASVGMENALVGLDNYKSGQLAEALNREIERGLETANAVHAECKRYSDGLKEFVRQIS